MQTNSVAVTAVPNEVTVPAGQCALIGIVVGTEVLCRLSVVVPKAVHKAGFHPTAVFGAMGAAAGVSAALFPVAPSVFGEQAIPRRPHSYRLTYKVDLPGEGKRARLWLPLPDR